jgi:cytochrome c-type biogenesis protein CcmE
MLETGNATNVRTRKRLGSGQVKYLIGGVAIALAIGYLIFSAARGSAAYYLTIEELQGQRPPRRDVRVSGNVVGESIVWEPRDLRLAFDITDESGQMSVLYHGARPDMFRDGAEVVVEGRPTSDGVFEARTMLLKCPSKYESEGTQ